jgi:hypothetical protein
MREVGIAVGVGTSNPNFGIADGRLDLVFRLKSCRNSASIYALFGVLGAFDAADVVSMCGGNDEKSWGWSLADVVSTWHMNNRNRSNAVLAVGDHSFCCRASSPHAMVGIVQGRLIVSAV